MVHEPSWFAAIRREHGFVQLLQRFTIDKFFSEVAHYALWHVDGSEPVEALKLIKKHNEQVKHARTAAKYGVANRFVVCIRNERAGSGCTSAHTRSFTGLSPAMAVAVCWNLNNTIRAFQWRKRINLWIWRRIWSGSWSRSLSLVSMTPTSSWTRSRSLPGCSVQCFSCELAELVKVCVKWRLRRFNFGWTSNLLSFF